MSVILGYINLTINSTVTHQRVHAVGVQGWISDVGIDSPTFVPKVANF